MVDAAAVLRASQMAMNRNSRNCNSVVEGKSKINRNETFTSFICLQKIDDTITNLGTTKDQISESKGDGNNS